jgi:hypothetical protein
MLLQREGADAVAASNRLIEPVPRRLSGLEEWLVHMPTGRIERASPMMLELGDTIYTEYEPTGDELQALRAGHVVYVTKQLLARLRSTDDEQSVAERMELPRDAHERVRRQRYARLHGAAPTTPAAEPAATTTTPPALDLATLGTSLKQAFTLPDEAQPSLPDAAATA